MKKVGHTSEFFLAFVDELQKQIIITKTVEVGQKKQNNFNIYNVELFKKNKEKTPVDITIKILII